MKDFIKTPFRIPPRQALNKSLKRWCIKASINPEGICLKSFRKTLISWLVATQEDKYIRVLASIGHDSVTSLRHYITIPFDSSDKGLIKSIIYGWGEWYKMNDRRCSICNTILENDEEDICLNCQSSMLQRDGIDMGFGEDFI